jgi:hypothetical protein
MCTAHYLKVRFIYEIWLTEVEKFMKIKNITGPKSRILTGANVVFLTVLQQCVTTVIQRIHCLAHCSEINAMRRLT